MIRIIMVFFLFISFPISADMSFIEKAQVGNYILVGKAIDSDQTYLGKVEIIEKNGKLVVTRKINDKSITGEAAVETILGGDAKVIRIRFMDNKKNFEETCLFMSDLDNYSRISCYLYQPGAQTSNPGLEVLFHDVAVD